MGGSGGSPGAALTPWVVCAAVLLTVAARLPLVHLPAWPDEAGFLTVGGGWRLGHPPAHGGLYGNYWVDRPPVLITLFGVADRLGGLVALRLVGAAAAAVTVAAVAWSAHVVAGGRATQWAPVVVAALLCSPFHWAYMVDGELLAAPAVALGLALLTTGTAVAGPRGLLLTSLAGVAGVMAILTKQNVADVLVFAACYLLLGGPGGPGRWALALRHAGAFLGGTAVAVGLVAWWTVAHGTRLADVGYAMYPYRVAAAGQVSWARLGDLVVAGTLSGVLVLGVWGALAAVQQSYRSPAVLALLGVLVFDLFSIGAGTSYWPHYLLQLVVPAAALAGVLVAQGSWVHVGALAAVAMALVGWVVLVTSPPQTSEEEVGRAIGEVAAPQDSLVTLWGRANVGWAAGLGSPYPHLWAVPARTLDPDEVELRRLLRSDRAPTWLVVWQPLRGSTGPGSLRRVVKVHYRRAGRICRHAVLVRRDARRDDPVARPRPDATPASRCESVTELPHLLRELR